MTRNAGTRFINKEKIKDKNMMITKNYIAKGEGANRFEKIPVQIYETADEAVKAVAREIVDLVQVLNFALTDSENKKEANNGKW